MPWIGLATSILSGKRGEKSGSAPAAAPKVKKKKSFIKGMIDNTKMAMNLAHMASGFVYIQKATQEGDLEHGVQLIGQVQGIIHDLPTVAQVIQRTVKEARDIHKKMGAKVV